MLNLIFQVCTSIPQPPDATIKFARADNKTKYRLEEQIYFTCEDEKAVVNDDSGLNSIWIPCSLEGNSLSFPSDFDWPECIRETECTELPEPSADSGLQKSPKIGDSVKVGEFVRYTCIRKSEFYETAEVCTNLNKVQISLNKIFQTSI